ncbi:hypothetical protein ACET3Z_019550 [Daucus carota]
MVVNFRYVHLSVTMIFDSLQYCGFHFIESTEAMENVLESNQNPITRPILTVYSTRIRWIEKDIRLNSAQDQTCSIDCDNQVKIKMKGLRKSLYAKATNTETLIRHL